MEFYKNVIFDWFFPAVCIGCRKEGRFLCGDCEKKLQKRIFQVCYCCEKYSEFGVTCSECQKTKPLGQVLIAAFYTPLLQNLIKRFKYRFSSELHITFGKLLIECLMKNNFSFSSHLLTFVPSHSKRQKWRGFNHAELLSTEVSKHFLIPCQTLLKRKKNTEFQSYFSRESRRSNIFSAFEVNAGIDIEKKHILIIDDVISSGATLEACAATLKSAGAVSVTAVVVASKKGILRRVEE